MERYLILNAKYISNLWHDVCLKRYLNNFKYLKTSIFCLKHSLLYLSLDLYDACIFSTEVSYLKNREKSTFFSVKPPLIGVLKFCKVSKILDLSVIHILASI